MKTKMKGIYGFRNVHTDKWYIGQSKDIKQRYNQHINTIDDVKFHQALREYPDLEKDWEFNVIIENDDFTNEQLDQLEAVYITLHNSCAEGYNSTNGNHPERIDGMAFVDYNKQVNGNKTYLINTNLCRQTFKKVEHLEYFHEGNKKVLFIRNFEQADWFTTLGNSVTVITDLKGHVVSGANMVVTDNIKKELEDMADKNFDLIIANPPYGKIGAEITKFIVDNFEFEQYLNLLPANDYTRTRGLINHVSSLRICEKGAFEDAEVTTSIATLSSEYKSLTEDDFKINFQYTPVLRKFYAENLHRKHYAIDTAKHSKYDYYMNLEANWDAAFAYALKSTNNGVHKLEGNKLALDVQINVYKTATYRDIHKDSNNAMATTDFVFFNTVEEKDNFTKFWYEGKLMNLLLKGVNSNHESCIKCMPKVDWTRPWTDEEILKDYGYTDKDIEEILK